MYQQVYATVFTKMEQKAMKLKENVKGFFNQIKSVLIKASSKIRSFFKLLTLEVQYDNFIVNLTKIVGGIGKVASSFIKGATTILSHLASTAIYIGIKGYLHIKYLVKEYPIRLLILIAVVVIFFSILPFIISSLKIIIWALILALGAPLACKWLLSLGI